MREKIEKESLMKMVAMLSPIIAFCFFSGAFWFHLSTKNLKNSVNNTPDSVNNTPEGVINLISVSS